ncbi:MAG: hypothetical protein FWB76_05280, partial [Oscillospiraceae bacterium]|nr:hypothetical protein [Oscillospiraceae bacterium]
MDQHPHYHWGNAAHAQPQAAHPPGHDQSAAVPKSPARLTAQVYQNNHASLQWGASKGADGYIILRGSQPATMQPIAAVAERAFVDTTTQPGRTYFYCISGYNRHGKSRPCDYASVTLPPAHQHMQPSCMSAPPHAPMPHQYAPQPQFAPPHAPMQPHPQMPSQPQMPMHPSMPSHPPEPPTPPLQAPAQLCAFAHGSRYIALRWQSLHSDVQYRVFRSESPWSGYAMVGETGDTHYLDAAPEPMTKYYYFVQAVHNGRTSQASAMAEAQSLPALPTPEMPQNLRCIPQDNDSVELRWNAANAASAYVVYARYDPAEDFSIIGHALDCSFLHKDLPPDAYVEYCVQAYHDSAASEPTPICVCGG